jgi:nucleotide-binding universal stress UspA family protein
MKKILVPCDFSKPAVGAYRFALDLASRSKGEVHLIHVIELPVLHDTVLMPVLTFEEALFKELEENSNKEFEKITDEYFATDVNVKTKVIYGSTSRMILDYIVENGIDLVVMGTRGASGMKEVFIGSNTEKIVRHSIVPVLAIRQYEKAEAMQDIVFPNTLETQNQEDLVMKVKALQHFLNAKLHIVWVNTPTNFIKDTVTHQRLEDFAKRFMLKNYTINIFNDQYEESGIINFTHSIKANMIAMGTHSRKGLAHILSGSLAEDLVNHVDVPIWTFTLKKDQ